MASCHAGVTGARDFRSEGRRAITANGNIDFIVAGDVTSFERTVHEVEGRRIPVDPPSEILAKKLFYRAASFKPRDVYDMSAAIDLNPAAAAKAARAARTRREPLLRSLAALGGLDPAVLLEGLVPYEGRLMHADGMVQKVRDFVVKQMDDPNPADTLPKARSDKDGATKDKDRGR